MGTGRNQLRVRGCSRGTQVFSTVFGMRFLLAIEVSEKDVGWI